MADDFGSGSYLARTGQLGYSRPGANSVGSGGTAEGFPVIAAGLPIFGQLFGKRSEYNFGTMKWDKERGVDALLDFKSNQPPGIFGSPWQQSKLAQSLKSVQDALKSTATAEQVMGSMHPSGGGAVTRNSSEDEGMSR
jgi:hypothetical protein